MNYDQPVEILSDRILVQSLENVNIRYSELALGSLVIVAVIYLCLFTLGCLISVESFQLLTQLKSVGEFFEKWKEIVEK